MTPLVARTIGLALVSAMGGTPLVAQLSNGPELAKAEIPNALPEAAAPLRGAEVGDIFARRDARVINHKIPAPRGAITDRFGEPIAVNEVAYEVALQFGQFENAERGFVIEWARLKLAELQGLVENVSQFTDDELFSHYRHRRWLPLPVTPQMSESEARKVQEKLPPGLILHPLYRRHYPHGTLAAHIIGYTGLAGKLPTGPINQLEPMWEESEGRAGLEKIYNKSLVGAHGVKKLLFDEKGNKLLEEQTRRPRPGGNLVTTLNLKWQKLAEETLRKGCKRGAFVVLDAITGEVLVMASRPSFDLNTFIPGISEEDFKALQADPSTPLYGRAFQSAYPPASSYKPIVALAALQNRAVRENSTIYCPAAITIGNAVMNNWSKTPEGSINVKRAIQRSCNTWFYQIGIQIGPHTFLNLSRRLGFGSKTGLPLVGETTGLVPTDDYMKRVHKRRILNGDTANLSIGQGSLLASPLQVAQAMAGIGNGGALPQLQLIRQVQDVRGNVVDAPSPERRNWLGLSDETLRIVREGMSDVVNAGGGTGLSAQLSYTKLCGKTGTAQWGDPRKEQRLAWFAGFLPLENPRYSFAVLYEGRPGERVSGGRMAAPMVKRFFEAVKEDIKEAIAPPKRALIVVNEDGGDSVPVAIPVNPATLDGVEPPRALLVVEDDLPEPDESGAPAAIPVEEP